MGRRWERRFCDEEEDGRDLPLQMGGLGCEDFLTGGHWGIVPSGNQDSGKLCPSRMESHPASMQRGRWTGCGGRGMMGRGTEARD